MNKAEYMKVQYKHIPDNIRLQYNLQEKVTADNCIYIKIKKDMYGLKQAAILAYTQLKNNYYRTGMLRWKVLWEFGNMQNEELDFVCVWMTLG